jgi:hypothetical protein
MYEQQHLGRTVAGITITACVALVPVLFATAAAAAPGNGNGGGNGNAYGLSNGNNGQAATHQTSGNAGTSGTVTSPQPLSNADSNGVGANVPGPYDSTRNGSPSLNGNGNGNATGEPCAGCVGKADNKNPPGQLPGPSGLNAGYECDRNNGIGKTNPAHTGCVEENTVTPPVTPPVTPSFPPPVVPITPTSPVPELPVSQLASVVPGAVPAPRPAELAFTGSTILLELLLGILALGLGVTMFVTARVRGQHAES